MAELAIWNPDGFQCICESHTGSTGGIGDYYQESICPECHVGQLSAHQELPKWLKCGLCGFCVREALSKDELAVILEEEVAE